jgi:exoenzyme U
VEDGSLRDTDKRTWLTGTLGVRFPNAGSTASGQPVHATLVSPGIAAPRADAGLIQWANRPGTGEPIGDAIPSGPRQTFSGANGRNLGITVGPDGRVALSAPPPPVQEITFAGGGGKGAALPGAVRALHDSGVLKDVKVVNGASVGSMTASLVAAGCTTEEFIDIANDPALAGHIMEGKTMAEIMFGGGLTGEGMETLLRGKLDKTLRRHGVGYLNACINGGTRPDERVVSVLQRLSSGKTGPTFGDLRTLSKVIPDIKEVSISATYMAEIDPTSGKPMPRERPQLAIFSADTEPDMEVALAVRASAALPPVFKPVDITLSSGITARFADGGVLNNVPNSDSVGAERNLDPMPAKGSLSFVFEDDAAHAAADGTAVASRSMLSDWISKAPNSAANYATYRDLADRPDEMVIVPLRITVPPAKPGGKGEKKDFSGLIKGTLNFDMATDDRLALQQQTDAQTTATLKQRQLPKTRVFASVDEMLMSVDRADLAALAKDGFAGAAEALRFRDDSLATIATLIARANAMTGAGAAALADDGAVKDGLATLDRAAAGNPAREAFAGRELNRNPALDRLIAATRGGGNPVAAAAQAVSEALTAQAHARTILRDVLYPRMVEEDPRGSAGLVLKQADDRLRRAASAEDVNAALGLVVDLYRHRKDRLDVHGYRKIADRFAGYQMPAP